MNQMFSENPGATAGNSAPAPRRWRRLNAVSDISATDWNACFNTADPFVEHAFLAALETHGCASPTCGWTPAHVVIEDAHGKTLAAAPAYLKNHSWGEFVFDFGWAQAAERAGIAYYPKLLCAVPFTPVCGPRLGAPDTALRAELAAALRQVAVDAGASSLHALFLEPADRDALLAQGCVERHDTQFHWHNADYADFEDFLARLTHDRRKKIRRERRRVAEAGLRLSWARGDELSAADWDSIYRLYAHTYLERGQRPYLNPAFLLDYGRRPSTPFRVVSVYDGGQRVAAAIFAVGGDTLYGRHWGAAAHYHSLHFETCYYQGVDYCIRHGLSHFDAGTQGGHKLIRGFEPQTTCSAHWLADPRLAQAVARAVAQERIMVDAQQSTLDNYLPYRHDGATLGERPANRAPDPEIQARQTERGHTDPG